ncbi:TetR/AcrR family transcriptional regulator [Anaerosporobacter sp.]|uniref:TetR/AcrR family transcriptional regulator n=1 Tax=Anaerosporobacter sp. TaxID=1872529 RepID=UPI00286F8691|nr:TetR/AcrR family transcriptional regulator [Anaerosporobacter sp.]
MPKSAERCKEIRTQMKETILHKSMLYFARNGFAGTKISDLARNIGIAQGTIYLYFESKEVLYREVYKRINRDDDIKQVKYLSLLPISPKEKIHIMSKSILQKLETDDNFAAIIALNTQMLFEQGSDNSSSDSTYQSLLYKHTAKIISQGQKDGSVVSGSPIKLADYYWGVVYLYSLKKLFTSNYEMISCADLERTLLIGKEK